MRLAVPVFIFVLLSVTGFAQPDEKDIIHTLAVHSLSTLSISGKSNVNKYECVIAQYTGSDTLLLKAERGKGAYFTKGLVNLEAAKFDCGMGIITRDFVGTIDADQYPFIIIEFISFERMPQYEMTEEKFTGKLTITLAHATKPFEIRCSIVKGEDGFIHLKGNHKVKFSDFNLKPPTKMMGTIKADEKLNIRFHLVLQKL